MSILEKGIEFVTPKKINVTMLDFDPKIIVPNYVRDPIKNSTPLISEFNIHASKIEEVFQKYPSYPEILKSIYVNRSIIFKLGLPQYGNYLEIMNDVTTLFFFTLDHFTSDYFESNILRKVAVNQILKLALIFWQQIHIKNQNIIAKIIYYMNYVFNVTKTASPREIVNSNFTFG